MKTIQLNAQRQLALNVHVHNKIAKQYNKVHGEIFNDIEQTRLHNALKGAVQLVQTGSKPLRALDYGCGSGNLTKHLLQLNLTVTAADVSANFLQLVRHRHQDDKLFTLQLNGRDLSNIASESFDFIALYSVLHHIPDYLSAIMELTRICKPGGVIYLDHEQSEEYWSGNPLYKAFRKKALRFDWKKYTSFANYIHKAKQLFNPRYTNEGDIHVWPDDHIEWAKIESILHGTGFETVLSREYLHFNKLYRPHVFEQYRNQCADMRMMAFRKCL